MEHDWGKFRPSASAHSYKPRYSDTSDAAAGHMPKLSSCARETLTLSKSPFPLNPPPPHTHNHCVNTPD
jgi:hypothetical protein